MSTTEDWQGYRRYYESLRNAPPRISESMRPESDDEYRARSLREAPLMRNTLGPWTPRDMPEMACAEPDTDASDGWAWCIGLLAGFACGFAAGATLAIVAVSAAVLS